MTKNISRELSDEQIDRLAKTVLRSVILTDEETNDIADAPHLRGKLQNRIAAEKTLREEKRHWIFFGWNRRGAALAFGSLAILLFIGAAILIFHSSPTQIAAVPEEIVISSPPEIFAAPLDEIDSSIKSSETTKPFASASKKNARKVLVAKFSEKSAREAVGARAQKSARTIEKQTEPNLTAATDFIALSYLPASDGGQIVSVKVPRSMMVALGVTTNTERGSELVKAEIVIGDDGAARAIRFLRD